MATELKTDSWRRYMLYKRGNYLRSVIVSDEERIAIDAGQKFALAAYVDIWAMDAALVTRLRQFLAEEFHWYDRVAKHGTDLEVVQTLQDLVREGAAVVVPEDAPPAAGLVWPPRKPLTSSFWGVVDYDAALDVPVMERYRAQLERLNAERPTWAETAVMMDGVNADFMRAMFRLMPLTSAVVFSAAGWISKYGMPDLSGVSEDVAEDDLSELGSAGESGNLVGKSTLLGDARSFEYILAGPMGEAQELAAKTGNEDFAAKMLGYNRSVFGGMIHDMKHANGLRGDDNVIWHDNGDVYFRGKLIDNMHNY